MNYIILNDVNSNTIQGLIIQNLPPITKPKIRTNIEEIDGRDGDIITKLGYSAYEKEFDIGLYGNYDVDQVISYFNSEGTVTFSNEDDKFYKYTIIEQIDFERLIRFKTAKVKMHVQPFKYSNTDTDIEIYATETDAEGTNLTINNTENGASFLDMQLKGQTSQTTYTGKNLFPRITFSQTINGVTITASEGTITIKGTATGSGVNHPIWGAWASSTTLFTLPAGTYTASGIGTRQQSPRINIVTNGTTSIFVTNTTQTLETDTNVTGIFVWVNAGTSVDTTFKYQIEKGSSATSYEPYVGGTASPNPSYPQNVNVVTGNTSVLIQNKNIGRINKTYPYTDRNVTYDYSNGEFILSGTSNNNNIYMMIYQPTDTPLFKSGDVITIKNETNWGGTSRVEFLKSNSTFLVGATKNTTTTITFAEDCYGYRVWYNATNNKDFTGIYQKIEIEKGTTTPTDYILHQEQSYEINLGTIELCQISGFQDYIYKNNGNWFIHKEIGSYTFNGSENWYTVSTNQSGKYRSQFNLNNMLDGNVLKPSSNANAGLLLCDYYTNIMAGTQGTYGAHEGISIDTSGYIQTYTNDYNTNDISLYKTWLSTHNMKVYWVYATPTETQITDENLIAQLEALRGASTYINQTNIITSGDLAPIIYVNVDTIDTNEIEVVNSGNIYSKPVITITGIGTINLYLNDYQVFILELGDTETTITLDVENMEAYNINTGQLMNRQVTGDYNNFIFNSGTNIITWSGTIASVQVVNYSRWI